MNTMIWMAEHATPAFVQGFQARMAAAVRWLRVYWDAYDRSWGLGGYTDDFCDWAARVAADEDAVLHNYDMGYVPDPAYDTGYYI